MGIVIRDIRKSFADKDVLKGIDFEFKAGQINMIIGHSGCGKTVLIRTMVGLVEPDSGSIMYDEQNYWELGVRERRALHLKIGMLFQGTALFDSMTVEENVAFSMATLTNSSKQEISDRVNYCLERVELAGTNKLFPSELSGGMKKRVGIARAIVLQPNYLICDEPNSGLDPQTAQVIDELIQDITYSFNMTTIVITHDIKSVLNIGDYVLFLYKGQKEWEGTRETITESTNENLNSFLHTSGLFHSD